jgi:hypothetical protein
MINFKFLRKNIYWTNYYGGTREIGDLTFNHIQNILNCLNNVGEMKIPENYLGRSHTEWVEIFEQELKERQK